MDANTNITTTISETRPHLAIFGCKLIIDQVNHYVEFNEYPQTSETGVATVYDVSAWEPEEARKAFALKNIQYSIGDLGVKACEYASQELHTPHTEVDFEGQLFKHLFDAHEYSISKQTLGKFVAAHNTSCPYLNPETNQYCTGSPKLCEHNQ
ncbi:1947_t:CDS:2, partial [Paraglomus brasilianum]